MTKLVITRMAIDGTQTRTKVYFVNGKRVDAVTGLDIEDGIVNDRIKGAIYRRTANSRPVYCNYCSCCKEQK